MTDLKLNPRILRELRRNCGDDEVMFEFLREIVRIEARNRSGWWWREPYQRRVEEYSGQWRVGYED